MWARSDAYQEIFVERVSTPTRTARSASNCHGGAGVGGVATVRVNDQNGQFVAEVDWIAPALNNVLYRYNEDQVRYILNYGRPGTPMAAWGADGGGPLTTQQIDNVIDYLWSVQLERSGRCAPRSMTRSRSIDPQLAARMLEVRESNDGLTEPEKANRMSHEDEIKLGEILFNNQELASGSYSCARCHVARCELRQGLAAVRPDPVHLLRARTSRASRTSRPRSSTSRSCTTAWTRGRSTSPASRATRRCPASVRTATPAWPTAGFPTRGPRACSPSSRCGRS